MKTYTELISISRFEDRIKYLQLNSRVGEDTFGFDRYLNQVFYKSPEWRRIRDEVILRDNGFDLAHPEHPIFDKVLVHHMNPIKKSDVLERSDFLLNPEYLICVSHDTHNRIHYGTGADEIPQVIRTKGDTLLWKHT